MTIRETSAEAYRMMLLGGYAASQECTIFRYLERQEEPKTLQQIARSTEVAINAVSGRVNGMKKRGVVFEWDRIKCPITGSTVVPVWTQEPLPLFSSRGKT